MYILDKKDEILFESFFEILINTAKKSTCKRSKCGAIIVKNDEIIGKGFNSPPNDLQTQIRCKCEKSNYDKKVTDKTCCIHAEQRAIFQALSSSHNNILGSRLYFIRLDKNDLPSISGDPYCTICSKSALDVGIKDFALLSEKGWKIYDTTEYNDISFSYKSN